MKAQKYATPAMVIVTIIITLAMLLIPTSHRQNEAGNDKLGVAVTLVPYADFVRNIGGDKVDVTVMVPSRASPHSYEPTTSQMAALSEAEVYVKVGAPIEFELAWMDSLIKQNPDMLVINGSDGIDLISSSDPDEPGIDPHVWTSPLKVKVIVQNICEGLVAADPDNTAYYESNRDSYLSELDALDEYINGKFEGYAVRYFLIYHPSFGYFAEEYDLNQISIEFEGKEPTPQGLQQCIDLAEQYDLNYVFIEPQYPLQYAQTIADATGGQTAVVNDLPSDYIDSMRSMADAIALELE
jgi:zinc transport system substrate-binding protein